MGTETACNASQEKPERTFLRVLRGTAQVGMLAGAAGSLGLMFLAGRHQNSKILMLLFTIWVLAPFLALVWANKVSTRWSVLTRVALHVLSMVLTLGCLFIYGAVAFGRINVKVGFAFLVVPLVSLLFVAILFPIAPLVSGRLASRSDSD